MNNITHNNLKAYRLKVGLRQVDVARQLGLDFADRLSRWENGVAMPNVVNLFRLASIYKVSPQDLYQDLRQTIESKLTNAQISPKE
ncbi:MAG: helix-turn-helix transcriptional regulator [bacterium]